MNTKENKQQSPEETSTKTVTDPTNNQESCETGCCGGHGKQE